MLNHCYYSNNNIILIFIEFTIPSQIIKTFSLKYSHILIIYFNTIINKYIYSLTISVCLF